MGCREEIMNTQAMALTFLSQNHFFPHLSARPSKIDW